LHFLHSPLLQENYSVCQSAGKGGRTSIIILAKNDEGVRVNCVNVKLLCISIARGMFSLTLKNREEFIEARQKQGIDVIVQKLG